MPHRNVIRQFAPDSVYHCYNRGVEKRQIFMDPMDYGVFLNRIKQMLSDPSELDKEDVADRIKSFYGDVELIAYCLMPNHFHLLLHQKNEHDVSEFMRSLSTSYTMYFNTRYKRVGSLFQGTYKARRVDTDTYWQHISRYIHLNPFVITRGDVSSYPYSSLQFYKSPDNSPSWLSPERALESFRSYDHYEQFLNEYTELDQLAEMHNQHSLD